MPVTGAARGIKAALLYALIGATWIVVTDRLLQAVVGTGDRAAAWQTSKGWLFVAASAVFVYFLAQRAAKREQAARDREAELLVITDSLPGPVSRVDVEGRYRFANFAYSEWFNLLPSEVVGRTQREVVGDEFYRRMAPHYRRAQAGERVQCLERLRAYDGRIHWAHVTLIPDRGADGRVRGHFTIVQDVTEAEEERRAHAESEFRYRQLVEGSPNAILIYKDHRLQFANRAAQRLVGAASESDVTGRPWDMFVDEADRDRAMARVEQLLRAEVGTEPVELLLRRLDGSRVAVEAAGVRFLDQDVPALHIILRDISEQKSAEAAFNELTRSLEGRIARRTEELELARERAEAADRMKSLFLASVARALRRPLDSILRLTDEALRGLPDGPVEAQRERLEAMQQATRHLQVTMDDLLEISMIEAGELVLEHAEYDPAAVLGRTCDQAAIRARQKGLDFELQIGAGLERTTGDSARLQQILEQLLSNALQFTDAGGITVVAAATPDAGLRIAVSDTGIGIPPAHHEQVFHAFFQLRDGDRPDPDGTGLGLPIAR